MWDVLSYREETVQLEPVAWVWRAASQDDATLETYLCRALEDIAFALARLQRARKAGHLTECAVTARDLASLAQTVGFRKLAAAARGVSDCADRRDMPAFAATAARVARLGDSSLSAVWDSGGMSG